MTYTVIYRTGGTDNCQWHRALAVQTKEEATAQVAAIEHGGRRALYHETGRLDAIGLPTGLDA